MATLTTPEFNAAVTALSEHYGVERLRDRLAAVGAFQSRKGLTTATAIADRLYRLSGGLRLPVAATVAFSHLWGEMLSAKLGGEEASKAIEDLAEKVNECLDEKEQIAAGREADLDAALGAYRDAMTKSTGSVIAHLDMLLKSVPPVAERVRATQPAS